MTTETTNDQESLWDKLDRVPTYQQGATFLAINTVIGLCCGTLFGIRKGKVPLPPKLLPLKTTEHRGSNRMIGVDTIRRPQVKRDWNLARQKAMHFAPRFALCMTGFTAVDLAMCYARGKRDFWNRTVAGATTGMVGGFFYAGARGVVPVGVALGVCGAVYEQYYFLLADLARRGKGMYDERKEKALQRRLEEQQREEDEAAAGGEERSFFPSR